MHRARRASLSLFLSTVVATAMLTSPTAFAAVTGPGGITDGIDTGSTLVVNQAKVVPMTPYDDPSSCVDCEWHRVHLVGGASYRIEIVFPEVSFFQIWLPTMSVWEFTGAGPLAVDVVPDVSVIEKPFEPAETGDYYIAVGYESLEDRETPPGDYSIEVVRTDDIGEGATTNGRAGGTFPKRGEIELAEDEDWYRIDLVAGQRYTFVAESTGSMSDPLASPVVELRNASGVTLSTGSNSAGRSELVYTPSGSGEYFLVVEATASQTGEYQLSTSGGDLPADTSTWASIELGQPSERELIQNTNDRDWFALSLVEGRRYGVAIDGTSRRRCGCTLDDPAAALYDAEGNLLMRDEDSGYGLSARLEFVAPYTGPYFVEASTQQSGSGTYLLYAFEFTSAPTATDDWPADATTPAYVSSKRGWRGEIESAGDADWFATDQHLFHERYVYEVIALDGGVFDLALIENGAALSDVVVTRSGPVTRLVHTPSETAFDPRWLEVRGAAGEAAGAYLVRALEGEVPDDGSSTAILQVGQTRQSGIAFSLDRDLFPVALEAGESYTVRLEGEASGQGTLRCGRVALRSPAGDIVAEADPSDCTGSADAELTFVPAETGSFVVEASRAGGASTARGTYQLTVVPEPGFGIALIGGMIALAGLSRRRS